MSGIFNPGISAADHAIINHTGLPGVDGDSPATSKTANFTIAASGKFDNVGALATIKGTFANTPNILAHIARVDNFEVQIAPPSGKQIIYSGGTMVVDEVLRMLSSGCIQAFVNTDGNVIVEDPGNVQEATP